MKKILILILTLSLTFIAYGQSSSETKNATINLSDPGKPGLVKVSIMSGSIVAEGYLGKEILVESIPRGEILKDEQKKVNGMYLIQNNNLGLEIEEEGNNVKIKTLSFTRPVDIKIKVPINTSLNLRTLNNGVITVKNVKGDFEVTNLNGPITMTQVSGTVVAHSLNGKIKVLFDQVNSEKPMSFTTMNGNVDVTFPSNINFDVKLDNRMGKIYSDFNITLEQKPQKKVKDKRKKGGKYKISFNRGLYGKINRGGPELTFKTMNGNIYIRIKK